jgi:hypothetical protein
MVSVKIRIVAGAGDVSLHRNDTLIGRLTPKVDNMIVEYSIGDIYKFWAYPGLGYEFEKFEILVNNNPIMTVLDNPTTGTIVAGLESLSIYFMKKVLEEPEQKPY